MGVRRQQHPSPNGALHRDPASFPSDPEPSIKRSGTVVAISVDNMCSIQEANRLAQAIASVSDAYARETSEGISGSDRRYSPHTALYGYLPYMDI